MNKNQEYIYNNLQTQLELLKNSKSDVQNAQNRAFINLLVELGEHYKVDTTDLVMTADGDIGDDMEIEIIQSRGRYQDNKIVFNKGKMKFIRTTGLDAGTRWGDTPMSDQQLEEYNLQVNSIILTNKIANDRENHPTLTKTVIDIMKMDKIISAKIELVRDLIIGLEQAIKEDEVMDVLMAGVFKTPPEEGCRSVQAFGRRGTVYIDEVKFFKNPNKETYTVELIQGGTIQNTSSRAKEEDVINIIKNLKRISY